MNQTNNRIREEFEEYLLNNWEDRENLPVADWWLSKIDELLKSQREETHETNEGWCCACEYDQIKLEDKIKAQREELVEKIETIIPPNKITASTNPLWVYSKIIKLIKEDI